MNIKNIIFDLGGVIVDIDYHKTTAAFKALGASGFECLYSQKKQIHLFSAYETGKMSSREFRANLRAALNLSIEDAELDRAWNAMILDLPRARLDYLKKLSARYALFLFSNTNEIHLNYFHEKLAALPRAVNFAGLFKNTYYSHLFGYRKPSPESFSKIIELNKLKPDETLFIDDSEQHVLGARQAGLLALHLKSPYSLLDLEKLEVISKMEKSPAV